MNTQLQNIAAALRRQLRLTPTRVHNASLLLGIGLLTAAAGEQLGRPAALATAGALVLAFATLERVLLFVRSRG